jgi:hypothetical protein
MELVWVLFIATCSMDAMPKCEEMRVNMPSKEICEQVRELNKLAECWAHKGDHNG